jgi:hypothetical protein
MAAPERGHDNLRFVGYDTSFSKGAASRTRFVRFFFRRRRFNQFFCRVLTAPAQLPIRISKVPARTALSS